MKRKEQAHCSEKNRTEEVMGKGENASNALVYCDLLPKGQPWSNGS